ncbi:MAG: NAD(P)-dependent alcohol dehydrogenase [Alphaproteobacteria bacterium]
MKIRAAVFREGGEAPAIENLELTGPEPGEVLVRIVATGVCHTDIKAAGEKSPVPKPVVLGHEGAGVVEAVGDGVTKVEIGDHVVMTFDSCGHCPSCLASKPSYCHTQNSFTCTREDGTHYLHAGDEPVYGDFFKQSSFATHAIGTQRNVIQVPKDAPLEILGPLGCGVQTGAGAALNDLKIAPGETFAVLGVGTLGLSAIMAARFAGARRIVAVDRHAHRLDLAAELGADETIVAGDDPVAEAIMAYLPDGADCVLDTTGVLGVMRQGLEVLAPRGRCGFVTSPWDGSELPIAVQHLMVGRSIHGIIEGGSNPDSLIPMLVELNAKGRFPFDRLIKFYELEEIATAIHDSETGQTIKPVLRIG